MARKNMPTANNARHVARPAQGQAPKQAQTTRSLGNQTAPNYRKAGKVGTAGHRSGKTVYQDTTFRN
jgi:hypothetical protein